MLRGHRGPESPEQPGGPPSQPTGAALPEGGRRLSPARRHGEGEEQGAKVKLIEPCVRDLRVQVGEEEARAGCWVSR